MKIYLSSTLDDLRPERAAVMDALRKDEHLVKDSYDASPEPTVAKCLQDVRGCELYIGVVAWRYGWRPPGHEQSITELEYRAAVEAGIPRLIFLRPMKGWPSELTDAMTSPELHGRVLDFRSQLAQGQGHTPNEFTDPVDLALKVSRAVRQLEDAKAAEAETGPRGKAAGRGQSLMEPAPPPHPHRLTTGLLLLGVQGSDDAALVRLRDALPAACHATSLVFAPEQADELVRIDAAVARARCAALLVTPASWPRLRDAADTAPLLHWLDHRLGGVHLLDGRPGPAPGVPAPALTWPGGWLPRSVLPVAQWLATPGAGLGGELADLLTTLRSAEPDLEDEALVGLACTTIAMTAAEAQALAAAPQQVQARLGQDAFDYFQRVTTGLNLLFEDWTRLYGPQRGRWRPFGTRGADDLLRDAVQRLNAQPFYARREHAALLGNRVRLRPFPFEPALLEDGAGPQAAASAALRERGCLVIIDELSMLHPDLRPYASMFVSDANTSVATLSGLDPSTTALDRLAGVAGPFNIGVLVDRFGTKLDPRCELSVNSGARLRRWLRLAIPETLAVTDAQAADPERRSAFRRMAFGS